MAENTTKIISHILASELSSSTLAPVHTRNVVNVLYIAGIAFMIGIFLLLLWVNLFSRYCRSWHDTSVGNRFNRQWLMRRPTPTNNDNSTSKHRQQRISSNEEQLV